MIIDKIKKDEKDACGKVKGLVRHVIMNGAGDNYCLVQNTDMDVRLVIGETRIPIGATEIVGKDNRQDPEIIFSFSSVGSIDSMVASLLQARELVAARTVSLVCPN